MVMTTMLIEVIKATVLVDDKDMHLYRVYKTQKEMREGEREC